MTYYKSISYEAARELILAHRVQGRGKVFSIAWLRRTDSRDGKRLAGHQEVATGRFGVTKHLKSRRLSSEALEGTGVPAYGPAYDRHIRSLFCFWATSRKYEGVTDLVRCYRCIPFDSMTWLKIDGQVYKVGPQKPPSQH